MIKENSELRLMAREQLRGNWVKFILLCLTFTAISSVIGFIPIIGIIGSLILNGPLTLGLIGVFVKLARDENVNFEDMFDGFKRFVPSLLLLLISTLFIALWSFLLVIPGIIKAYSYSMAFYILNDNPDMGPMEALNASKEMMNGYKMKLFLLQISFIGWSILCAFTLGIGYLWLTPYIYATTSNFYVNLSGSNIKPKDIYSNDYNTDPVVNLNKN